MKNVWSKMSKRELNNVKLENDMYRTFIRYIDTLLPCSSKKGEPTEYVEKFLIKRCATTPNADIYLMKDINELAANFIKQYLPKSVFNKLPGNTDLEKAYYYVRKLS